MKIKLLLSVALCSFAMFACEEKVADKPTEISNEIDNAIKATELTPEAKSAATKITAENVDAEAAALLKEIENDKL